MRTTYFVSLLVFSAFAMHAQQPVAIDLVMPDGDGRLVVPSTTAWVPTAYRLEDNGYRTTLVFEDHHNEITLEASVFPSDDNSNESCRRQTIEPLLKNLEGHTVIKNTITTTRTSTTGVPLAISAFLVTSSGLSPLNQENVFAFAAGPHLCAELHLTQSNYNAVGARLITDEIDHIRFNPEYKPTAQDYSVIGSDFYETKRDFRAAAAYFRRALDSLDEDAATRDMRRNIVDQLSASYAYFGDVKNAYNINEQAIAIDPTYPYYYYNLACVDADLHNPLDARRHLEQAFTRRNNVMPGEQLPDPVHDASLQRIAYDKSFWGYAQSVSRTLP
jgi:tetratricopeptide (TPR) repeat protein